MAGLWRRERLAGDRDYTVALLSMLGPQDCLSFYLIAKFNAPCDLKHSVYLSTVADSRRFVPLSALQTLFASVGRSGDTLI